MAQASITPFQAFKNALTQPWDKIKTADTKAERTDIIKEVLPQVTALDLRSILSDWESDTPLPAQTAQGAAGSGLHSSSQRVVLAVLRCRKFILHTMNFACVKICVTNLNYLIYFIPIQYFSYPMLMTPDPTLISFLTELKTTTIDTNTALKAYLSDKNTVAMSKVKEDQFSEALQAAGIKRVQTKISANQVQSTPYKWDERDEDDQTADVIEWLRELIPEEPLGLKYHDISTKKSENAKVKIADLTLSGRGDIKISTDDTVGYDSVVVATLSGATLCQGMSEMMAAASLSCHPVLGILTDTQKWAFYWMRTKKEIDQIPQQLGNDPKPLPEYFDHPHRTLIQGSDFCNSFKESNTLDLIPFLEPCDQLDVYANHYYKELSYFV
ncbi:hypothetical protein PROFUN_15675 [Planoprotostelium fungivorum]|uniref:Uncharacterized protein n=1 Tax=Planoprotostelium fungivorum TaxID=1890364 RepID=A0A2P6MV47_9EUKA|nr:hypothetical protein PROFUN_15675 [Planoprotostelium fungivorum]